MRADDINSIESEAGIIASLIHNPELIYYSEFLLPNHFTNKENRLIYTAISDLVKKDIKHIDPYNIIEDLNSSEATRRLADGLSVEKLQELFEMSDVLCRNTVEEYKLLVSNVLDAAFRQEVFRKLQECQGLCYDRTVEGVQQKIYSIIDETMTAYSVIDDTPVFGEVIDDLWDEIEAHQDGKFAGIPFKFPTLNEYVTIEPGELVVLGAPAKGAKSMFMLNEAVDLMRKGKSVMYIDSELSSRLFLCRLISHVTGIEFRRVRSGNYTAEEEERIKATLAWVKEQRFVHLYMPLFSQDAIYTAVQKISHKFDGLDVLIVDYLKSSGDSDAFATYAELGKLTDMVKNDIAGAMGIAALAAAQLNNYGKLADSAKIYRNASSILLLTDKTEDEMEADGPECGNKKLIVSHNRNGMQHVSGEWIDIEFEGNTCLLTEAKQHIPVEPY